MSDRQTELKRNMYSSIWFNEKSYFFNAMLPCIVLCYIRFLIFSHWNYTLSWRCNLSGFFWMGVRVVYCWRLILDVSTDIGFEIAMKPQFAGHISNNNLSHIPKTPLTLRSPALRMTWVSSRTGTATAKASVPWTATTGWALMPCIRSAPRWVVPCF